MRGARLAPAAYGLVWVGWLAALGCGCRREASPRQVLPGLSVQSAGVLSVTLAPAESLRIRAVGAGLGSAPSLHLWDPLSQAEAARATPGLLGSSTRLVYRNPERTPRTYSLLLENTRQQRGRVDLLRDERPWLQRVTYAARIPVPPGRGYSLQLAAVPGGVERASLYAIDCEGRLRAVDQASGPTGLPRVEPAERICYVIVDAPAADNAGTNGRVNLYVNDPFDRDGDGLGRGLERALATCDDVDDPGCSSGLLAGYYRSVRQALRDTDRDGLLDADEVFGRGRLLDLPRYGAQPRHKDVFVEVDHDARLSDLGLREQDFVEIAALFAAGSARELRNPDGRPGVRLHFDTGFDPQEPGHIELLGAWGGSTRAKSPNYRAARAKDFSAERAGYFRYAFLTRTGRGQTRRDAFTVNRDLPQRVPIFAHELGHALGLEHHGADAWGRANCKPNYYSIMNYVYQNRADMGFSRGAGTRYDPSATLEPAPLDEGVPVKALTEPPLEYDVFDGGIDWNRDGLISETPVRAGLTWATYKSCGAAGASRTTLREEGLALRTPVLTKLGDRLYALLIDESEQVYVRHARVSGPDAAGSCPEGEGPDTRCMDWSMESLVHGLEHVRHMSALRWSESELALAYVRDDDMRVHVALLRSVGEVLELQSDVEIPGALSADAPSLARPAVSDVRYGVDSLLRVLFRAGTEAPALMQASALGPQGPFRLGPVFDDREQTITIGVGPTVAQLGTGEHCAVFPDLEGYVRFYCYDSARDVWIDLSASAFQAGLGPQTVGPVGLAYHRYRQWDGAPVTRDGTRGAVFLSFTEPESPSAKNPDNPHLFISEWLSAAHPARKQLSFRWRGSVIDEWTNLAPATSVALYEDETLSALKALMLTQTSDGLRLEFLPFADSTREDQLGGGNDFELMERGICAGLRGAAACGGGGGGA